MLKDILDLVVVSSHVPFPFTGAMILCPYGEPILI